MNKRFEIEEKKRRERKGLPTEVSRALETGNTNSTVPADSEDIPVRELPQILPLLWFHLPEGPERDALRAVQENTGCKDFSR
jgi:hypothetical protein